MKNQKKIKENLSYFCPYSFEFINHLIGLLGYSQNKYDEINTREKVFEVLTELFNLNIIYVFSWFDKPELEEKKMNVSEILKEIDKAWFFGAKYPDFYSMIMFGYSKWYVDALTELGFDNTVNWKIFVQENIGDIKEWAKEKQPKEER